MAALSACGAKTGLTIPDADIEPDAGMDAGTDAGADAFVCSPDPLELDRRGAQILFVVDRSNSMNRTIDDRVPMSPADETRWELLAEALDAVFAEADPERLEVGAKFFPQDDIPPMNATPLQACTVTDGLDLPPAPNNFERLLRFFTDTGPDGGTPTAAGLQEARDYFARRPELNIPRFVVLATDGGPNCNPDPDPGPPMCTCTGMPVQCNPLPPPMGGVGEFAPFNCLDEGPTLDVIEELFLMLGIPVYVIGIDDPTRPDLGDVLDRMAVAGGRPRDEDAGRRFYSVRNVDDLRGAFETVTEAITNCVFEVDPPPPADATVTVTVDGIVVPRDRTRAEGWDFTTGDRTELTLFGGACERATATEAEVFAIVECPE